MHPAAQEPGRLADQIRAASGARRPTRCASSAIRSPAWLLRRSAQAKDAAEAVVARYRAAARRHRARATPSKPGAPLLYDEVPDNIALDYHYGDTRQSRRRLRQGARMSRRCRSINQRLVVNSIEPRSAIGDYDGQGRAMDAAFVQPGRVRPQEHAARYSQCAGRQSPHPHRQCRRLVRHEGRGLSGICLHPACRARARPSGEMDRRTLRQLRVGSSRPRLRHDASNSPSTRTRRSRRCASPATAISAAICAAFGPLLPTVNVIKNIVSVYRTPLLEVSTQMRVHQHDAGVGLSRRRTPRRQLLTWSALIDYAALELGIDRLELRKRNFIKPREIPFKAASGMTYDCGDFPGLFKHALDACRHQGLQGRASATARSAASCAGSASPVTSRRPPPTPRNMGGIRFEADGTVTIITGTLDYGQGHASTFAQVLSEQARHSVRAIRLLQGDSDQLVTGGGTGGSRSAMLSGTAIVAGGRQGDRARQADRRACAGSLRRRHRIQRRPLRHRRHRPLDRHHGPGRQLRQRR